MILHDTGYRNKYITKSGNCYIEDRTIKTDISKYKIEKVCDINTNEVLHYRIYRKFRETGTKYTRLYFPDMTLPKEIANII